METVSTANGAEPLPRRTRRGGKRVHFVKRPRPAWPVRGLWEAASEEQRDRAHRTCTAILELWLARKTSGAVAAELGLSPVRVWQLSQSALSGMLAGLLKQPRWRGRIEMAATESEHEELLRLRKQTREQEAKLKAAESLIVLLRGLPANRTPTKGPTGAVVGEAMRPSGGKKRRTAAAPGAARERDGVAADGGAAAR